MVLFHGILLAFRDVVHLCIQVPSIAIGSVPSFIRSRTQLRTDSIHFREAAGAGPVVLKTAGTFNMPTFIPIVGVGTRGEYELVHGDLPRQHSFGTTLRFTSPLPADSRQ